MRIGPNITSGDHGASYDPHVLWRQSIPISRVQSRLAYVRTTENLSRESLKSDGESTMRRHAKVEHPEMAFKSG